MCKAVYFGDAPRQGQVITSFEEWEVANMTTEKPQGYTGFTSRQNRYRLWPW